MTDLHQLITDRILEQLEQGVKPWQCPWLRDHSGASLPQNFHTGQHYRGINILLLWLQADIQGYSSNAWLTFKQAKALGAHVRKGEKATLGIFYKPLEKTLEAGDANYPTNASGEPVTVAYPMAKAFYVFNLDQIDGIERPEPPALMPDFAPIEAAEQLLQASGAVIHEGGNRACYIPSYDEIHLPDRQRFQSEANFYATACHELTHWTGHPERLARDFNGRFGEQSYAFEELVAELGSAYLGAELGLNGVLE
ncbi:MAG: DUF1738 domain-containing protein, partial [Candidatus Competibacteraceae bacterium]|nr:DUF1738 domain-containing protein [Candidatus Competibacteraceae bacterium]